VFNQVLEGMGDLQVARVVQERLFPRRKIVTEGFRLFGRSLAMRELGGDYFDYFPVAGERWGVVIGDVTGHGVPAALGMAIAKVGVKGSAAEQGCPADLLHRLDRLFGRVKGKRTWSMSLCYLVFDGRTGQGTIASAGHPGPIHVSPRSGTARYLSLKGSLLGYNLKRPYPETPLFLEPGDALVLYSDGLFETPLRDGSPLGIPRWKDLVGQVYDSDPEVYFQNILTAHAALAGSQEAMDDITLVILVREGGR
jgi:sigma-B regulation protein RsbU (phosphoserine phosphatase)